MYAFMVITYRRVYINRLRLPILFVVSCVHVRAYNYTFTRQVQATTYTCTGRARHKRMYTQESTKGTPVHVQAQAPAYTNQVHRSGCPYRTLLYKHKHSCTLRASLRMSMPNTVKVQAQDVRARTSTHVHYVRRPVCPCHKLYMYTYSAHPQAPGPTHKRCIAQAVHAKHCTRRCTVCTPKNAGSRTLGASLKLPMPNTVYVHVPGARHERALTSNRSTADFRTRIRTVYTR